MVVSACEGRLTPWLTTHTQPRPAALHLLRHDVNTRLPPACPEPSVFLPHNSTPGVSGGTHLAVPHSHARHGDVSPAAPPLQDKHVHIRRL